MAVILPRTVLQGRFQGHHGLVEGRVADRMHLDLHPFAVGPFREADDLLVAVVENPAILRIVRVRLPERRVLAAEAAVQGRREASPHPGELPFFHLGRIQGLEEEPGLKAAVQPLSQDRLQRNVQIERKTDPGNGMHHSDPPVRQAADGLEHVPEGPGQGDLFGQEIGDGEERLLIHLPGLLVPAAQALHFLGEHGDGSAVQDAGMAIILDDENRTVRTGPVELFP